MKKRILPLLGVFALSAMSLQAQITKNNVWAPTVKTSTEVFTYGGSYKNTVQAGVTITVLDKGYVDATKPSSTLIADFKFPHWNLNWHFNSLSDNKDDTDPSNDVPTTYFKASNIAYGDIIYWLGHIDDPTIPFAKTVAASHLPTRNGIFFAGVDALGNHAMGLMSHPNTTPGLPEVNDGKDWGRLQTYAGGGNAVLVETVDDFIGLLNWGKTIVERNRTGDGSTTPYAYKDNTTWNNFTKTDSVAVFGLKVGDNDNALAFYPGKYDKTNVRLAFQFDESLVSSDISFKLLQVSKGTSGKNVKYKMIVSIVDTTTLGFKNIGAKLNVTDRGCDKTDDATLGEVGPERYVIDNIFELQGVNNMASATTINVAELIKTKNAAFTFADFSKKRIIVSIIGEATEAAAAGTYHPIVAIDDINVSYWINWYNANNSGLGLAINNNVGSSTQIEGLTGQIQITGAVAAGEVYTITGQKVASFNSGDQVVPVQKGFYLVKELGQSAVKVYVK